MYQHSLYREIETRLHEKFRDVLLSNTNRRIRVSILPPNVEGNMIDIKDLIHDQIEEENH